MLDLRKYLWLQRFEAFSKTPIGISTLMHVICLFLVSIQFPSKRQDKFINVGIVKLAFDNKGKIGDHDVIKQEAIKEKEHKEKPKLMQQKNTNKNIENNKEVVSIEKKEADKFLEKDFSKLLQDVKKSVKQKEKIKQDFDNLLKNVKKPQNKVDNKSNVVFESILKDIKKNKHVGQQENLEDMRIPISDEIAIKHQIYSKWSIPSGIKNLEQYVVDIFVVMDDQGRVISANIESATRGIEERVVAESALRAVLLASPLRLISRKKIGIRKFVLRFDLKEALS